MTDLAIAANDGGAFDHGTMFDDGPFADKHVWADIAVAIGAMVESRAKGNGEVGLDLLESVPGIFAIFEKNCVLRLGQVKKVFGLVHGQESKKVRGWQQAGRR